MPLQIRRGTELQRTAMTVPLAAGELLFVTSPTNRIYVGDGTTLGGIAVTGYTNEDAQDAVAPMFTGGSHSGINFVYNDASNIINATVDLSNYNGTIRASSFKGTLVADDSTALVDAVDGRIFLDGTVKGNIVPNVDVAYDLGSATYRFRDLYLSGSSIKLGAATITATGTAVNLPAGSTIGGSAIGIPGGDLNVNIVADDSTVIVNTTTEVVTAQGGFVGNVTGNVTGSAGVAATVDITNTNGLTTVYYPTFVEDRTTGQIVRADVDLTYRTDTNTLTAPTFAGNLTGNVTGNVVGTLDGDVVGSVFNDNSVLMVSGQDPFISNGIVSISANSITSSSAGSEIVISGSLTVADTGIKIISNSSTPIIETFLKNTTGSVPTFLSYAHRGTDTAPTVLSSGDSIWSQSWLSYDGATYTASAVLEIQVDSVASGDTPAKIFLVTIPNNNVSQAKGIQITENGVAINNSLATPPAATLDINGFAKLAVLTSAPASLANGMVAIADGISWDPAGTGKSVMVVYLAGGWRVAATAP